MHDNFKGVNLATSRKPTLSVAGALFCLIVIFIHIVSPVISGADRSTLKYTAALSAWRLSAFVVQGFVLTAAVKLGLKFKNGDVDWKRYYLSRVTRILIPYILWVAVYYLWFWLRRYYEFSPADLLRYILVGDLAAHFYFVVTIVQFYALAPLWKALTDRMHAAIALPAAALVSLLSAQYLPQLLSLAGINDFAWSDRVFTTYLIWWIAGLYIGRDWDAFARSLERGRVIIALSALLFGLLDARLSFGSWVQGEWYAFAEPVHMLYAACAIMLMLSLGAMVREGSLLSKISVTIDGAGYGIYLSHVLVLSITNVILDSFGITGLAARFIITAAVVYTVSLAANIGYYKIKAKIKLKSHRLNTPAS
jgi:peptidoglycan/LPS O-acetylase OafA/YrhL